MKRLLLLLILLGWMGSKPGQGQVPHLRVSALINWPDTVYQGQVVPVGAIVQNIGNVPFQGLLQIVLQTDSTTFSYLYYNQNTPVTIQPLDTLGFFPAGGYLFDSTVFRPGNNVVVVWPYSAQSIQADTFTVDTWFYSFQLQGVNEPDPVRGISLYPNPALHEAFLKSTETRLEGVRILNCYGSELQYIPANENSHIRIPLDGLPAGLYLLQVIGTAGELSTYRLIRHE